MAFQSTLSPARLGEDALRRNDTPQQPDGGIATSFELSVLTSTRTSFPQSRLRIVSELIGPVTRARFFSSVLIQE
jgi:hypothetical protein